MFLLSLLSLQPAAAFAPGAELVGEGLEPQRIQVRHHAVQAEHLRSEAFRAFAAEGEGWRGEFDEHTGTPRTLWGGGIPVRTSSDRVVASDVRDVIERHPALFGLESGSLSLRSASYSPLLDTWYVDLDLLRDGLATYRGGIRARVKAGNLVLLHVAIAPEATVRGAIELSEQDAIGAAISSGPAPQAAHTEASAEPILLDLRRVEGHELRKAWMVRTHTADPPGIWVSFVDGRTGNLLSVHNEVRFVSGTVEADHHVRGPLDSLTTSPVPLAFVTGDTDGDTTDENGAFTVADSSSYITDLDGAYVDVRNAAGADGELESSSPNLRWTTSDATQAEIDTYVFTHRVRAWGQRVEPSVPMVQGPIVANVNINDACNAYFDGNINFFLPGRVNGSNCNNTGEIADVIFHEWGHGFHYFSIESGFFDGSLSEGASDTVSFLQTGDSVIGPGFYTNGSGIRNAAPDRVYPADFTSDQRFVHSNGLIFAGAMWDLWNELKALEGDEVGTESTERIFAGLLKGGTDIPGTYAEALLADDDDGNLANGTPHTCSIIRNFGDHGLGPGEAGTFAAPSHEALVDVPAGSDHALSVELLDAEGDCDSAGILDASVLYRVNGGDWEVAALTANEREASGAIPEQADGSFVEYYLLGQTVEGSFFTEPAGGEINPFTFVVGDTVQVRCRGFEGGDGGFVSELVEGNAGGDDWEWGVPEGLGSDPADAFDGDFVWGNNLDVSNGQYRNRTTSRLHTPTWNTRHYTGVFLQYRRWLTVEDAVYDQARIYANGDIIWANHVGEGSDHHLDDRWMNHVIPLDGRADRGDIELTWELRTDPGLEFGGWTLDDVCLMAPATPDNRLGVSDFVIEAIGDTEAQMTWTHPAHAPVELVRVVRRFDRYPEGADDGDVVQEYENPSLSAAVTLTDTNYEAGDSFYAVYGFDGEDWSSFTIEGLNAGMVDLVGGIPPEGYPGDQDGDGLLDPVEDPNDPSTPISSCGCSGTGNSGLGAVTPLALLGLLLIRRRRQR